MEKKLLCILIFMLFAEFSFSQPFFVNENVSRSLTNSDYGIGLLGGGISFYDFNNDGWDDLTLSTETNQNIKIYENIDGIFQQLTLNGITVTCESKSVIWVDVDNDGDNDLFVTVTMMPINY